MQKLAAKYKGIPLYKAGLPHFPRNFARDGILSAILAKDWEMLKNQLIFCGMHQGKRKNPKTGEEPGKIFHEYPGARIRGLSTEFNACDTTALFLIGHEIYSKNTRDKILSLKYKKNIKKASEYIISHLQDNLFIESPEFCGAKEFALKVTYWKDSALVFRKNGEPAYPICYTLAHIQNMAGLRSAVKLLKSKKLLSTVEKMRKALRKLYDYKNKTFYLAIDKQGPISAVSSDALHALFYLDKKDLSKRQLLGIIKNSKLLETTHGYRTLSPKVSSLQNDGYHARTLWPYEQAVINMGARKFGNHDVSKVSARIKKWLKDSEPEIFVFDRGKLIKGGCDPQLWTVAAKKYFATLPPSSS